MPPADPQMLKGVLSLLLLRLLAEREDYGYALVVRLREAGFEDLSEGTVYPALTRLEAAGDLRSRLLRSSSGPARKYYAVTPRGQEGLRARLTAWEQLTAAVAATLRSTDPDHEVLR
ncbi:PadR family transcriptional regulator [Luteipulveratus sp. YIM 133132]|uniref:PadR family transcriptional regulator n=1 Tax=Luteipulveratus flavus TaxID=3031728 RepID=A0ABT6C7M4_9MICO|nr:MULTISPECIES: PadR family transcriptional regulator [unclassified Luteipulveratus]MDE9366413.1 PadR family transcriptional regulator [Luteipulveratus sp. YIM 133132]MDF8264312.1 PadR family transcriptional regulator [Luteipulveratus sp. YIM 133296]